MSRIFGVSFRVRRKKRLVYSTVATKFASYLLAQFYHSAAHGKWTIILYNAASVELKFSFLRKLLGWLQKGASMSREQLL